MRMASVRHTRMDDLVTTANTAQDFNEGRE